MELILMSAGSKIVHYYFEQLMSKFFIKAKDYDNTSKKINPDGNKLKM